MNQDAVSAAIHVSEKRRSTVREMKQPFWGGECGVKSCCEAKGLDHCGVCPDFPCEMLSTMGVEEGFDPEPKIAQCRIWAGESTVK